MEASDGAFGLHIVVVSVCEEEYSYPAGTVEAPDPPG